MSTPGGTVVEGGPGPLVSSMLLGRSHFDSGGVQRVPGWSFRDKFQVEFSRVAEN